MNKKIISLTMDRDLYEEVVIAAYRMKKSTSEFVSFVLEDKLAYFERNDKKYYRIDRQTALRMTTQKQIQSRNRNHWNKKKPNYKELDPYLIAEAATQYDEEEYDAVKLENFLKGQ